ncbi:MAG: DUF2156 domain-containing protein [Candidatus Melainabacteria bacterium]|nr:DUF2156 domain-containing protein [Candidatus Melainabacteria bacterium]
MEQSPQERLAARIRNFIQSKAEPALVNPAELTLTRGELGKTLHGLKRNQEVLQTAVANARERSETAKFRFTKLQKFGRGSLAYSSLQEGLQYFMHDLGYVAYRQLRDGKNSVVVLADPICQPEFRKEFLLEFLKFKSDPVFLHVTHETGEVLNGLGFRVNELGVETIIDIQDFDLIGNKKQQLRQQRNNARKDGLEVFELTSVDNATLKAFKKISDDWLKDKVTSDSEMRFIVRPLVYIDELDVRKFVAKLNGEIVGFVIFDPMYENGESIGYIANHLRTNLHRSYSVVDYIILEAMEKFKAEGKRELSLGLSPLAKVDDQGEFKHSKLLSAHFRYAFEKANYLYNFKNLAQHKLKYRPGMKGAREEKVYCAMKTRMFLIRLNSVYTVLGLKPLAPAVAQHVGKKVAAWIQTGFKRCLDPGTCEAHNHDTGRGGVQVAPALCAEGAKD